MDQAWVYILKCSDGSYYTGKTQDLQLRIAQHENGTFRGYTYSRRPVKVAFVQAFPSFLEAIQAERQIKNWTKAKKEALIRGDMDTLHQLAACKNETHHSHLTR
jgi:predicted GIY-YIG superfamily endonuclease